MFKIFSMYVTRWAFLGALFTVACCITIDDCPKTLPRDENLILHGDSCYYFHMESAHNHTVAQRQCGNYGGRLAVIYDNITQSFLQSMILDRYKHKGPVWIGLTNVGHTDIYLWDSGIGLQYSNWAPGQPPSVTNGCVAMETNQGGVWMVFPCYMDLFADPAYPFVCEFSYPFTLDDCPDGLPRDDNLKLHRSSCFYFMMEASYSHATAQQSCGNLGGHLPVIYDNETQTFLQSTMLTRYHHKGPVWIGLKTAGPNHTYIWDSGDPVEYTNWAPGHPSSIDNGCVAMETNQAGVWMVFPCTFDIFADPEYPFVCEFPLTSECRQCGDASTGSPCTELDLVFAPVTKCSDKTPYCMNDVYRTGGHTDVYQRCVDRETCHKQWYLETSQNLQCISYNPNVDTGDLECHFCCYGDHCNSHVLPPANTWYQPDGSNIHSSSPTVVTAARPPTTALTTLHHTTTRSIPTLPLPATTTTTAKPATLPPPPPTTTTTITTSTTTTTLTTVLNTPSTCYICEGLQCFLTRTGHPCPPNKPLCHTTVNDTTQARTIKRGCIAADQCRAPSDACTSVEAALLADKNVCAFCCTETDCNIPPALIPVKGRYPDWS